jgi:hypothetical protein
MIVHGSHGASGCHLLPKELMEQSSGKNAPAQKIPRVKGHGWDWVQAIGTGRPAGSNFDYGGPLTEVALFGLIALRFPGQALRWDERTMRFDENKPATALLRSSYRPGWSL